MHINIEKEREEFIALRIVRVRAHR